MRNNHLTLVFILVILPGMLISGNKVYTRLGQSTGAGGEIGVIDWPVTGELIQGAVVIRGSTPGDGLRSYEVDFALTTDPTQSWILIQEGTAPVQNGILAVWDTTTLTDGEYNLRLLVNLTNGHQAVTNMYNLHVQNVTVMETTDPLSTAWYVNLPIKTSTPTAGNAIAQTSPERLLPPTPTQLPDNPVEISPLKAFGILGIGAGLSLAAFILVGGYLGIRHLLNNQK